MTCNIFVVCLYAIHWLEIFICNILTVIIDSNILSESIHTQYTDQYGDNIYLPYIGCMKYNIYLQDIDGMIIIMYLQYIGGIFIFTHNTMVV